MPVGVLTRASSHYYCSVMSKSNTEFLLSDSQWALLEEQLELRLLYELLQCDLPSDLPEAQERDPQPDDHDRKRKSLLELLKRSLSDTSKLALLRTTLSTKQPKLAFAVFSESGDSFSGSREQDGMDPHADTERRGPLSDSEPSTGHLESHPNDQPLAVEEDTKKVASVEDVDFVMCEMPVSDADTDIQDDTSDELLQIPQASAQSSASTNVAETNTDYDNQSSDVIEPGNSDVVKAISDAVYVVEDNIGGRESDSTTSEVLSTTDLSVMSPLMSLIEDEDQEVFVQDPPGHPLQACDRKLVSFYKLMVGDRLKKDADDSLLVVETKMFSADVLLDCCARCQESGLASEIKPYMVDLLKRQQSLDAVSSLKELKANRRKSEVGRKMPAHYFSYKHRDLFIALLEVTPDHIHSRLMNLCSQLNRPVPFLYRKVLKSGNIGLQLAASGYGDLLCHPTDPFIVSYGTTLAVGKGKTHLLTELFGFSEQSNAWALECSPGGPCHKLSIDMVFDAMLSTEESTDSFILADAHGYNSSSQGFNLVLATLSKCAACTLLHVCSADFSSDGKPNGELLLLLNLCIEFAERPSNLALLWRDYSEEDEELFSCAQSTVCKMLSKSKQFNVQMHQIGNLIDLNEVERENLFDDLKDNLITGMKEMQEGSLPAMESVKKIVYTLSSADRSLLSSMVDDLALPITTNRDTDLLSLGTVIHDYLEQEFAQTPEPNRLKQLQALSQTSERNCLEQPDLQTSQYPVLTERLFPALTTVQRIVKLEDDLRKCAREGGHRDQKYIAQTEAKLMAEKRKKNHCSTSQIVKRFAAIVAKSDTGAIQEFSRQLEAWKKPKCAPLINERRELHETYENKIASFTDPQDKEILDRNLTLIKSLIQKNSRNLDAFDISIDDFWSELIALTEVVAQDEHGRTMTLLEKECGVSGSQLCSAYTQCIMRGHPMQLLRGHPLYMPSEFMSEVLRSLQVESERQLFVVSVIGAQSSAKSTLLNYLFGCGFATRAGRCTKGLYASYMQTESLDVLVLDSEGLMSVESGGRDFDNQVTLMAMACSHIVIINHKGDLSRQLQELLEVALFAMHYLEVTRWRPDVLFALRDQVERDYEAIRGQLLSMRQSLDENASKMKVQVSRLLKIHSDSLFLLPPAFANEVYGGKEVKLPTVLFSNDVLALRQKMFSTYRSRVDRQDDLLDEMLSLEQWLVHARSVWTTITAFGSSFVQFESLQQIEQRREVVSTFKKVASEVLEGDQGYKQQCEKVLHSFLAQSHSRDLSCREVSDDFHAAFEYITIAAKGRARQLFSDALKKHPYGRRWKVEFDTKLESTIDEERLIFLRAWRRRVDSAKDQVRIVEIEKSLIDQMDRLLEERGNLQAMNPDELQTEFDIMWEEHVKAAKKRLEENILAPNVQEMRVVSRFLSQITASEFADDIFPVLKKDVHHIPQKSDLLTSKEASSYSDYVKHTNAWRVKHKVSKALQISGKANYEQFKKAKKMEAGSYVKGEIGNFLQTVRKDLQQESGEERQEAVIASLMKRANAVISLIGRQAEAKFDVDLQIPQFANAVYDALRYEVLQATDRQQRREVEEKLTELRNHKEQIGQRAMTRLHGQHSDIARAWSVVEDVYSCLIDWARNETLNLSVRAEQEIRNQMPDASTAAVRAFESSFEEEDWEAVVEYSVDANRYLETLFNKRFEKLEHHIISSDLSNVRSYMSDKLEAVKSVFLKWADRKEHHSTTKTFLSFAKKSKPFAKGTELQKEKSFGQVPAYELDILSRIPETVEVASPKPFANAVVSGIDTKVKVNRLDETVEELFRRDVRNARRDLWETVRGCQEVCPICNSKCERDEGHLKFDQKHHCRIHLLPAFHGSRSTFDKAPILDCCTSSNVRKIKWRRKNDPDGVMKPFDVHISTNFPSWDIPLLKQAIAEEARLKRAWVNCRRKLLQHYDMADKTPQEWIELYEQENALT